jgi:uncharacterized protein DUF2188
MLQPFHPSKADAVKYARHMARRIAASGVLTKVRVIGKDGRVQKQTTYRARHNSTSST